MNSLVPAEARFLVLGSKAVGKSALTVRFLTKRFIGEYQSLMQLTYNHTIKLDDEDLTFDIRDAIEKVRKRFCLLSYRFLFMHFCPSCMINPSNVILMLLYILNTFTQKKIFKAVLVLCFASECSLCSSHRM